MQIEYELNVLFVLIVFNDVHALIGEIDDQ